jgi:acyl carrier protein phosphodiesterase
VAKVVQAISMIRVHAVVKDLEPVVAEAERLVGRDYRIVGEPGVGWVADFEEKK